MEWLGTLGDLWLNKLVWLAGLAVVFGILARLMPCNPGMYWWKDRRAAGTDFMYWFVVPLFLRVCRVLMLMAGMALLFGPLHLPLLALREWPLWQQCLTVLLLQDILLYGMHRFFHTCWAWPFHAVHHSPKVLDWMALARFHPLNDLLAFSLADVVVLLLGFSPAALVVLAPFNIVYSAMVHANLKWTFGPLRYLFASPVFHRWHHTTEAEGLNKNFASTFPLLDILFGTFYMPPGKVPEEFGNGEPNYPEDFWGQLLRPFRRTHALDSQPAPVGTWERILKWMRRRPIAAMTTVSVVATLSWWIGTQDFSTRSANSNPQYAGSVERERPRRSPTQEHPVAVLSVAMSADGQLLVSGHDDGTVKLWDADGHEKHVLRGHTCPVTSVALSADGRYMVSGDDEQTVKVWDAATGREQIAFVGDRGPILSVALSGDGRRLVFGTGESVARVWSADTPPLALAGHNGVVFSVAVSADGKRIVSASEDRARTWDAQTGLQEHILQGHTHLVPCVAISADGTRIVSGSFDRSVKVWDAFTGREQFTFKGHSGPVLSVAISGDGQRIVSGSRDGTVKLWTVSAGHAEATLSGHTDAVTGVAISADGQRIGSGSRDGTIRLWDAGKYEPEKATFTGRVCGLSGSAN